MNGYTEVVAMLLAFCQARGINADSDTLHKWVTHYFEVRFAEQVGGQGGGELRYSGGEVMCEPGHRCRKLRCFICHPERQN